jgi:hypothetical protein
MYVQSQIISVLIGPLGIDDIDGQSRPLLEEV